MKRHTGFSVSVGTPTFDPGEPLLIYSPSAARQQMEIIGWQRNDFPENRREQGGLLLGRYLRNPDGSKLRAEVTEVLQAQTECRFCDYIEWSAMEEFRMQQVFFDRKEQLAAADPAAAEDFSILGWWHTHPNSLPVFMSSTDLKTQELRCFYSDRYAVVLNPHRGIWKAFLGKEAREIPAVMNLDDPVDARMSRGEKRHARNCRKQNRHQRRCRSRKKM